MNKKVLSEIKLYFRTRFKKRESLIACLFSIITFSVVFFAGALSNETKDEICAEYYKNICLNYVSNKGNKKIAGLVVEPKPESGASMAYDTYAEINNIWGAFKGEDASFAPVVNANKDVDVHFVDTDYSDCNLSILYSSVGGSTDPYHMVEQIDEETKEKKKVPIDYKFQCSPLATMFNSTRSGPQKELKIYISQRQAESKLAALHTEKIDLDSFRSLLGQTVDIYFDGELRTCIIDNIYLDNFQHNYSFPYPGHKYNYYYGTDVGNILGDFIFVSTYALNPGTIFPQNLVKQGMYFMSEYSYRNKFYLEYARDCYSPTNYTFKYAISNLKEGFIPDETILQRAVNASGTNVGCALLTTLLSLMFVANLVFVFLFKLYMSLFSIALLGVSSIVPYLLFRLIFKISGNVSFFSSYSTILNMILLIVLAISIFVLIIFSKALKKKEDTNVQ